MTQEERLKEAKRLYETANADQRYVLESLFPELKESEDERVRKWLINTIKAVPNDSIEWDAIDKSDVLSWLEKQKEIDKTSYEIAEKEKYDFVSGQYIECRKSFDVFKEENSYWFEYVGNDNYIGRSDNILNQKFHITPRQLYCLFTQQHCPKENKENEETNAPTEYGKYVDECLNEAAKHFFPELKESEDERVRKELLAVINDLVLPDDQQSRFVAWLEKHDEQKPADKVDPFKIGDWVMNKSGEAFSNGSISARVQRIEGHKVWFEHGTYADEWVLKKITD